MSVALSQQQRKQKLLLLLCTLTIGLSARRHLITLKAFPGKWAIREGWPRMRGPDGARGGDDLLDAAKTSRPVHSLGNGYTSQPSSSGSIIPPPPPPPPPEFGDSSRRRRAVGDGASDPLSSQPYYSYRGDRPSDRPPQAFSSKSSPASASSAPSSICHDDEMRFLGDQALLRPSRPLPTGGGGLRLEHGGVPGARRRGAAYRLGGYAPSDWVGGGTGERGGKAGGRSARGQTRRAPRHQRQEPVGFLRRLSAAAQQYRLLLSLPRPTEAAPGSSRSARKKEAAARARAAHAALLESQRITWIEKADTSGQQAGSSKLGLACRRHVVILAVLFWYFMGVVSITTTKLLLTDHNRLAGGSSGFTTTLGDLIFLGGGLSPLLLTMQQFAVGVFILGMIKRFRAVASDGTGSVGGYNVAVASGGPVVTRGRGLRDKSSSVPVLSIPLSMDLFLAGLYFSLGFLTTNMSFRRGDATFVETIKAAEPITSAATAVLWRIETLGAGEITSLGTIVAGVVVSTLGHRSESKGTMADSMTNSVVSAAGVGTYVPASFVRSHFAVEAIATCSIVMLSNLCFSFRGLHQKLFRASQQGGKDTVDDVALQLKMQQIGLIVFAIPALLLDSPNVLARIWQLSGEVGLFRSSIFLRYIALSLLNGAAFTSYNLASTFVLTRISVVHHAALNCMRRVFAIVMTSFIFAINVTRLSWFGILISVGGFSAFTHYKLKRLKEPRPLSSLLPMSAV